MLLAIDTSTPQMGIALYDGARLLAEHSWLSQARHTVELAPSVQQTLARAGLSLAQMNAIGVAIGPGSFTSLRVGLSFVKGIAQALNLPLIGIDTLSIVAAAQPLQDLPLACLLPAGRGRHAVSWYRASAEGWQASGAAQVNTISALSQALAQETLLAGDLTASERSLLLQNPLVKLASPALSARRPGILAELAYRLWQKGETADPASLAPLYLHIGAPIPADSSQP